MDDLKKNICPVCKGSGEQTITVVTFSMCKNKETASKIVCSHCKGKELTEVEAKEIQNEVEYYNNLWCKCKNVGNNVTYVEDNDPNGLVSKHHWIHTGCKKVVQIG